MFLHPFLNIKIALYVHVDTRYVNNSLVESMFTKREVMGSSPGRTRVIIRLKNTLPAKFG